MSDTPLSSSHPGISVVIPVRNGERYLAAALESLFAQTSPAAEVIVVDDASTDATADILAAYGGRLQVVRQSRCTGPARARNEGIRRARGPYVAFLDADDLWESAKLEHQLAFAARNPDFGIITTDVLRFDDAGRVLLSSLKRCYPIVNGHVVEKLLRHNWVTTSATLVRLQILLEAGGFDEEPCRLGEDWVLWMRIASRYPVYFLDQVLTRRRVRPDSYGHADPETSFRDLVRHRIRLQKEIPQLQSRPELARQAVYSICLEHGIQDFHHLRMDLARAKFRIARQFTAVAPRARFWTAASRLPAAWVGTAKRWKRTMWG